MWCALDEVLHGRRDVEVEAGRVERFTAKETQAVHVSKMGMGEEDRTKWRVPPNSQLFTQGPRGFNEMALAVFINDTQTDGVLNVFRTKACTTRTLATRMRTVAVLGDSKQCHRRHGCGHEGHEHEPFHAKVSNLTTKPVVMGELCASAIES